MLVALRAPLRLPTAQPARDNVFGFLARRFTPHTIFMEIGGAGYELALRAAGYVERVYAIDVSGQLLKDVLVPCNVRLVLCDGVRIPVPVASIDVAWGGDFVDRLHPDDAREHRLLGELRPDRAGGIERARPVGKLERAPVGELHVHVGPG